MTAVRTGRTAALVLLGLAVVAGFLMLTATGFVTLVSSWFGVVSGQAEKRYFGPLVLVLTAGFNGALLTADLFNLFVFIEVMLVPSYALIILAHRGR